MSFDVLQQPQMHGGVALCLLAVLCGASATRNRTRAAPAHALLANGTCASAGMYSLTDFFDCQRAALVLNVGTGGDTMRATLNATLPTGCLLGGGDVPDVYLNLLASEAQCSARHTCLCARHRFEGRCVSDATGALLPCDERSQVVDHGVNCAATPGLHGIAVSGDCGDALLAIYNSTALSFDTGDGDSARCVAGPGRRFMIGVVPKAAEPACTVREPCMCSSGTPKGRCDLDGLLLPCNDDYAVVQRGTCGSHGHFALLGEGRCADGVASLGIEAFAPFSADSKLPRQGLPPGCFWYTREDGWLSDPVTSVNSNTGSSQHCTTETMCVCARTVPLFSVAE